MSSYAEVEVTTAGQMVKALEVLGVKMVFGLPGVHNLALWDALRESAIELVGVRHEQTAGYAADGYARVTGGLGVALTTTGPGAANAVAATGEAWSSGSPIVVIATDIPASLRRVGYQRGVLHETADQAAMFAPLVKQAIHATDPNSAGAALVRAGELALMKPSAPVYFEVPTDVLSLPASGRLPDRSNPSYPTPADEALLAAANLLARANRPLIWVGRGASAARAAVETIAERVAAPVIETVGGRGVVSPEHPCWVGFSPHLPEVGALWDNADVVLAIGTNFSGTITQNWALPAPPTLISINLLPESPEYDADVVLVGDAAAVAERLCNHLPITGDLAALTESLRDLRRRVHERLSREDPLAMTLIEDLAAAAPADTPVCVDMCIPGYWVAAARAFSSPGCLISSGWGTLGYGFPASIGMALARNRPTLSICGDGGFLFACGELSTLAERRPPLTTLIFDDGGYGMLRFDQQIAGKSSFGVDFPAHDLVALARAFNIEAARVETLGAPLRRAVTEALATGRPHVIVVDAALTPPESTSPRWYRRRGVTTGA